MGGKPAVLKRLEKGKIIDAQDGFVDTFNFLVDFIHHLQGDADQDEGGAIQVDRTLEDFPVIRFLGSIGGGGSSLGVFQYDPETGLVGGGAIGLGRKFVKVEGMTEPITDGSVRVKITYGSSIGNATAVLETGDGFEDPTNSVGYIPLYEISGGEIVNDYRGAPVHVIRS